MFLTFQRKEKDFKVFSKQNRDVLDIYPRSTNLFQVRDRLCFRNLNCHKKTHTHTHTQLSLSRWVRVCVWGALGYSLSL